MLLKLNHILAAALIALALAPGAAAQSFTIGAWQGARGLGISAHVPHDDSTFNSYCVAIDFEGMIFAETDNPGFRFSYARLVDTCHFKTSQTKDLTLYYGPGVMAGLVANDMPNDSIFVRGLALCVCAIGGIRAQFDRNVEMSLEWGIDLGVHLCPSSRYTMINSSIYLPGLTRFYLPQLKLHYMF